MLGMKGVEFLREVRRDARLTQLPIVLTTIEPEESELLGEARRLGVTAVVKKPWHPQQLRDVVEAIVHPGE
jgi:CheY-like chemotaxis protein